MDRVIVVALMALAFPYAATHPVVDVADPVPDSIVEALEQGRYWKASVGLRDHLGPVEHLDFDERIILAEAESGWKNWSGALEALTAGSPDVNAAVPEYWYLLGLVRDQQGDRTSAAQSFERYLGHIGDGRPEALIARSRLIQGQAEIREWEALAGEIGSLRERSPVVADWTALALARGYRDAGRPGQVVQALDGIIDPTVRDRGWDLETRAWVELGDTASALAALERARIADVEQRRVGSAASLGWRFKRALGDPSGAVEDMALVISEFNRGQRVVRATQALLDSDPSLTAGLSAATYIRGALALAPAGHPRDALRAWSEASARGATFTESHRLSRASALTAADRVSEALEEYRALSSSTDAEVGAPALKAWARIRSRQGRRGDVRILEDRLVERYPTSQEALDVVFFRGDDHHDAGRLDLAADHYARVIEMSSSSNRAGLARMRWAQIHVGRENYEAAAQAYEEYLTDFPRGRRWEEASFWGAWSYEKAGQKDRGEVLIDGLYDGNPVSYYTVAARDLYGLEADWDFPEGDPLPDPSWLQDDLVVLDVLRAAGLDEGLDAHVAAMKKAAWDSDALVAKLAVELIAHDRSMDGINLGWELRRRGAEWDQALLRVVYPFPYRDVVLSFAEERDLDPFLVAGLIRQESAFVPDIISHAGAVGLMQVMPATGTELARAIGPSRFQPESLKTPEVNVHLGTRFLADALRRYDQDLPIVLSAYNAGPTRANRWRHFPEASDPWRFTERIPFAETRSYVKNVTRNRSLYTWLYADEIAAEDNDR